jgi:hypothetical protein
VQELGGHRKIVGAWRFQVGAEQLHGAFVHEHRGVHVDAAHRIDADEVLAEFDGE